MTCKDQAKRDFVNDYKANSGMKVVYLYPPICKNISHLFLCLLWNRFGKDGLSFLRPVLVGLEPIYIFSKIVPDYDCKGCM